jgi:hypothetical protein
MTLEDRIDARLAEAERQARFFAVKARSGAPFHKETSEHQAELARLLRDVKDRLARASEVRVTSPGPDRPDTVWLGCGVCVSIQMDGKRPYLVVRPTATVSLAEV